MKPKTTHCPKGHLKTGTRIKNGYKCSVCNKCANISALKTYAPRLVLSRRMFTMEQVLNAIGPQGNINGVR